MIVNHHFKENIFIVVTFLAAFIFMVLPQPTSMDYMKPQWVFVVLLFWLIHTPRKIGPTIAWFIGLYVDLLLGNILGEHAFIFVVFAYFIQHFLRVIQAIPLWQQVLGVGLAGTLNIGLQLIFLKFTGVHIVNWHIMLPVLADMIIWPWLYFLCREARPKHDYRLTHFGR